MSAIDEEATELANAVREFREALPDWWYTCGSCKLTGHASVGPDREGCDAHLLQNKLFDAGFDVDVEGERPGAALRTATAVAVEARKAALS